MGSFVRNHTTGTSASGTAVTATLAANVSAQNLLVVWVAMDNTSATAPVVNSIDKPGGETATWARIAFHDASSATSAAAVRGELWAIRTTQQWNSATVITATLSASPPKSHMLCQEHTGVRSTVRGTSGTNTSTTGVPSAATSGTALVAGDLVIGGATFETSTTPTADSDTTNGSWAQTLTGNTGGGATAAQVSSIMQHKYVTATGVQTYNPTANSTDSGAAVVGLQFDPTIIATANQVTETDTAQAIAKSKTLASAQITETNTAQAITRIHARTLGQATETNIAQPITLGAVADANAGATVRIERCSPDGTPISTIVSETLNQGGGEIVTTNGGGAISITIPAVSVTDTTLDPGDRLRVTLWIDDAGNQGGTGNMVAGQSVQFYINGPVGFSGQARATFSEALTQFAGAATIVGRATETDVAQAISRLKTKAVSQAVETDTAQVTTARKTKTIGQAAETDTATVVTRPGVVNRATETDLAQPVTRAKTKLVNQVIETNVAQAITGRKIKVIGQTLEADTANVIARHKTKLTAQAVESDIATSVARPGVVSKVIETDAAQPIARIKRKSIGQLTEASTAFATARLKTKAIGQSIETDVARVIRTPIRVGKTTETDIAQPVLAVKRKTIGSVTELTTASTVARSHSRMLGTGLETNTATTFGRRKIIILGRATETNVAAIIVFGGLGSTIVIVAAHPSYSFIGGYPSVHTGYVLEHEFIAAASELVEV